MDTTSELPANVEPPLPAPVRRKFRWWMPVVVIVVILLGIAVFLASIGTPVYLKAITNAKREAATAFARQIEQSVTFYYTDNQITPAPSTVKATRGGNLLGTDTPEGVEMINLLAGDNPRKVKYLAVREARGKKDGATFNPTGSRITGLYDPWGNPWMIVLDTNYEERITVPFKSPVTLNGRRGAVYSAGPDGILETKDDIKTWSP